MASPEPTSFASLQASVRGEEVIAQAVGLIMNRYNLDAATARNRLDSTAERNGITAQLLAAVLLDPGNLP